MVPLPYPDLAGAVFDPLNLDDIFLFGPSPTPDIFGLSTFSFDGLAAVSPAQSVDAESTFSFQGYSVTVVSESPVVTPGLPGTSPDELLIGCGIYEARIVNRGGFGVVGELIWSALDWGRVVDDTSAASVTVDVAGAGYDCCDVLALIEPWQHELAIFRGDIRIWSGAVVNVSADGHQAVVSARDLSVWWDHRLIHGTHVYGPIDPLDLTMGSVELAQLFSVYARDAMDPENSAGVYVNVTPTGINGVRNVLAKQHLMAGDVIRELTRTGIDWTAVDRTILAGGLAVPTELAGTMTDEDFIVPPTVVKDGLEMRTRQGMRGAGVGAAGDDLYMSVDADTATIARFGLLEAIDSEPNIHDTTSLAVAGRGRLAALAASKAVIQEGSLSEDSSFRIEKLVGGTLVRVSLSKVCLPVNDLFRIRSVKGQAAVTDDGSTETITVGFIPAGLASIVSG